MGDQGGELAHGGDAVRVRELKLHFLVAPLALARFGFRLLAFCQVEHEGDAFVRGSREQAEPISTGTRLPSFLKNSFSRGGSCPGQPELIDPLRVVSVVFCGRHIVPADRSGNQLLPGVAGHAQKGIVRVADVAVRIPEQYSDDIGIDEPADASLAFLQITVEQGVLKRDRSLSCQQLQHRDPIRCEGVRCQGILEIEQTGQLGLLDQRQAKDRSRMLAMYGSLRRQSGSGRDASSTIRVFCVRMT